MRAVADDESAELHRHVSHREPDGQEIRRAVAHVDEIRVDARELAGGDCAEPLVPGSEDLVGICAEERRGELEERGGFEDGAHGGGAGDVLTGQEADGSGA